MCGEASLCRAVHVTRFTARGKTTHPASQLSNGLKHLVGTRANGEKGFVCLRSVIEETFRLFRPSRKEENAGITLGRAGVLASTSRTVCSIRTQRR